MRLSARSKAAARKAARKAAHKTVCRSRNAYANSNPGMVWKILEALLLVLVTPYSIIKVQYLILMDILWLCKGSNKSFDKEIQRHFDAVLHPLRSVYLKRAQPEYANAEPVLAVLH